MWYCLVLPADLHWFEVDQADVVAAKQKLLGQLAAEVPPQGAGRENEEAQQPGTPGQSGLTRHLRSAGDAVQTARLTQRQLQRSNYRS